MSHVRIPAHLWCCSFVKNAYNKKKMIKQKYSNILIGDEAPEIISYAKYCNVRA